MTSWEHTLQDRSDFIRLYTRRAMICVGVMLLVACSDAPAPVMRIQKRTEQSEIPAQASSGSTDARSTAPREPVIVQGSGKFVALPDSGDSIDETSSDGGYQLNFVDVDIETVVASVIGEGLGLPYSVDPQVKGTITLQASRPLRKDQVLPALEAALEAQGVALVNVSGTYHAVLAKDALKHLRTLHIGNERQQSGFSVQIVPVQYVSATEIEKALHPFAPEGGIVRVDEARNLLVLAGSNREMSIMLDVVKTFDVNWLEGMSFGLFPVEYVDVTTLADELSSIFQDKSSPLGGVVRLVPLSRLNSLMVITQEPSYLKQVEGWIKRLDIGLSSPGRRIYIYDVQNGKADDLARSLSQILSISVSAPADTHPRREPASSAFSSTSSSTNSGLGMSLANRPSAEPARLTTTESPQSAEQESSQGALKIVPNVENNALLIYATPNEFSLIENALKRLDVVPIQVLIEASLAEVTLTDDLKFGLQWSYQSGDGPIVLSESSNGSIAQKFPGFSYLYTGRQDIRAVLNAIEAMTDVKVVSSPKLLVLNNREAELQIGDQVPITVQSSVSTVGETAPIVNSVQLRDTGVILRITPRANKSGLVMLDIAQEVSDVVPTTTSNIDSPTIQQRRLASSIAVRDGETIALGGLIRDSKSRSRGGVPYLRRIPFFGNLFGSTDKASQRTELIVLITPSLVRSSSEAENMMDELREQFKGLRKMMPVTTSHARAPAQSGASVGTTLKSATAPSSAPKQESNRPSEDDAHENDPAKQ